MKYLILALACVAASQANSLRAASNHLRGDASRLAPGTDSRIVNGQVATRGQFPHQAYLVIDQTTFCGGALISPEWVLTSAHCGHGVARSWEVTLGGQQRSDDEPGRLTVVSVEGVVHSAFSDDAVEHDLTLVHLPAPVELSEWIQPVALPKWSDVDTSFVGVEVVASGWGKDIDNTTEVSDQLNYVTLTVIDNPACAVTYGSLITDAILCCRGTGGATTCNGDSGGPLTTAGDSSPTLIALTSFVSSHGCESGLPSGYTRLTTTQHLQWISDVTGIVIQD